MFQVERIMPKVKGTPAPQLLSKKLTTHISESCHLTFISTKPDRLGM